MVARVVPVGLLLVVPGVFTDRHLAVALRTGHRCVRHQYHLVGLRGGTARDGAREDADADHRRDRVCRSLERRRCPGIGRMDAAFRSARHRGGGAGGDSTGSEMARIEHAGHPDLYQRLTETTLGTRLIVWPESAPPVAGNEIVDYITNIYREARAHHSALVTGVVRFTDDDTGYNSSLALVVLLFWFFLVF